MSCLLLCTFLASALSTHAFETPAPYDCFSNFDNWQLMWNPGWKAWCCLNHNRGCVATHTSSTTTATVTSTTQTHTTSTETSSTSTVTSTLTQTETSTSVTSSTKTRTSVTATRTSTISPVEACKVVCNQGGHEATCGDRLMWVSEHVTNQEVSVCEAAAVLVIADCPDECAACTPEGAGCTTGADVNLLVKRYDATAMQSTGTDGRNPVLAAVGLMMVAIGIVGLFGLVATRSYSRRLPGGSDSDALLVDDDPAADA